MQTPDNAQSPQRAAGKRLTLRDLLVLAAITVASLGLMGYFFHQSASIMGPVEMGIHGWIALVLGVILSMALGIGLMALVFFSARRGFDDRMKVDDPDEL